MHWVNFLLFLKAYFGFSNFSFLELTTEQHTIFTLGHVLITLIALIILGMIGCWYIRRSHGRRLRSIENIMQGIVLTQGESEYARLLTL